MDPDPDRGLFCIPDRGIGTYRALVRLLAGVATHMYDEHILGLEGLLLARTVPPLAHEMLLVRVDMVVRDVLKQKIRKKIKQSFSRCQKRYTKMLCNREVANNFTSLKTCVIRERRFSNNYRKKDTETMAWALYGTSRNTMSLEMRKF